jgi:cell division transport system permease protein
MKPANPFRTWLTRHAQVSLSSLGRLYRAPLASIMTAAVIGIALALPSGLYLLTTNLQQLSNRWDGSANFSLFLKQDIDLARAQTLASQLSGWPEIAELQLITPNEALAEFRDLSGFGETLNALDENPLPAVLSIKPARRYSDASSASVLLKRLQTLPEVELAQLDLQWVKRFNAIVDIVRRSIWIMAALLGLAVLLIVGNTIRLEIQNRRPEIEITKLIGATNAFIRRPFLYAGFWYGLAGASLAMLLVELTFLQLHGPVQQLASLYQSGFRLQTLSGSEMMALVLTGIVLGLLGALLAVGRHLAKIEPT